MTIRANRLRALLKTFLWVFIASLVLWGVVPRLRGQAVDLGETVSMAALAGIFLGAFVSVVFSPSEVTWTEKNISIKGSWPSAGEFEWNELEAWSPYGNGVFLLKFAGQQAYQIAPAGFTAGDWKTFKAMMKSRFGNKRTLLWIGPRPIKFRKD